LRRLSVAAKPSGPKTVARTNMPFGHHFPASKNMGMMGMHANPMAGIMD